MRVRGSRHFTPIRQYATCRGDGGFRWDTHMALLLVDGLHIPLTYLCFSFAVGMCNLNGGNSIEGRAYGTFASIARAVHMKEMLGDLKAMGQLIGYRTYAWGDGWL